MKINTLEDLINYWNSDEGKPYKGSLIDWDMYKENPENLGCMCAQGQVLVTLANVSPMALDTTEQGYADIHVAEILDIPVGQAILLRNVNDTVAGAPASVLTNPEQHLGPNAEKVLTFWRWLDKHRDKSIYFMEDCVFARTEKYDILQIDANVLDIHNAVFGETGAHPLTLTAMEITHGYYDEMAAAATLELMYPDLLTKQFFLNIYREYFNDFPN